MFHWHKSSKAERLDESLSIPTDADFVNPATNSRDCPNHLRNLYNTQIVPPELRRLEHGRGRRRGDETRRASLRVAHLMGSRLKWASSWARSSEPAAWPSLTRRSNTSRQMSRRPPPRPPPPLPPEAAGAGSRGGDELSPTPSSGPPPPSPPAAAAIAGATAQRAPSSSGARASPAAARAL